MSEEYFDVYNNFGECVSRRLRRECHGNSELLHRAVHVVILHDDMDLLLLQKRSSLKDIQPGKWDTAVGGHLNSGEDYLTAAQRELSEELGIFAEKEEFKELFDLNIRNEVESEDVRVYLLRRRGDFTIQESEIDEVRFWRYEELFAPENQAGFTPNLCVELVKLAEIGVIRRA